MGEKTLAFAGFKRLMEDEIRTFWHVMASLEYANRWVSTATPSIDRLVQHAGDNRYPFKGIDITVHEFTSEHEMVSASVRENSLVSFVTAFETYLLNLMERGIYLDPNLVSDSDLQFPAKDLANALKTDDRFIRRWLANKVADKYLRNKTHREMIQRIDTFCKAGISAAKKDEIAEWSSWSLVRNAIVHTSRRVTAELSSAMPERFPTVGSPLKLNDRDLMRVHTLARLLAEAIDERAIQTLVAKKDALLLVREYFVHFGEKEVGVLKQVAQNVLQTRLSKPEIDQAIKSQVNETAKDHWELSSGLLRRLLA